MSTAPPIAPAELPIPKKTRSIIVAIGVTIFLTLLLTGATLLALYNLLQLSAVIPSVLWLLIVGLIYRGIFEDKNFRQFAAGTFGNFARKQFIRVVPRENQSPEIQFGYQLFKRTFFYFKVPLHKIERVYWRTGQASNIAGRDVHDWQVIIWYDHDDLALSKKRQKLPRPDQNSYCLDPSGSKETIAPFGRTVVEFLRHAGANLLPGETDTTFLRQS